MSPAVKIAAAALFVGAAYYFYRAQAASGGDGGGFYLPGDSTDILESVTDGTAEIIDQLTGGAMKLSAMAQVTASDVNNRNVQAFLRVIRRGEGTASDIGYRTIFGGSTFDSFADHPRRKITKSGYTSTAAGAYQALSSTWDETKRIMGLTDFSPASQDWFGVGRIAARGALADVIAGRFTVAIGKVGKEWASLPGSPYGQPTITMATAASVFAAAGGVTA